MQFRQKALSRLQSPEELDLPVRFARPPGRLVLAVTLVAMAAAAVWGVTGTVTNKIESPGVLTHAGGSYVLQSPLAGQVTGVFAEEGDRVEAGAPLLRVRTQTGPRAVRAVEAGEVTTLLTKSGSVLTPGADVATVERAEDPDEPLVAMVYVQGSGGSSVKPGAEVDLTVPSVPQQQYGVLRGRVEAVGRAPQTAQQISGFLGNADLARQFAAKGNPLPVLVKLEPSSTTKSGYEWSSEEGPPHTLDSTTPVSAAVHLDSQHPVDWLLP
ncbi:HlyD family efflux transporter periplasmic adaptor subunit [Streptomyces sulphureus]|uniref:HlyD family efflux transporter periplasmic adaptor subunit n=1 Tax=Streptomyces sulphureus TaxID=47758 RepID=UPI000367E025|nr:HlyD family efflux transporter periplasmic adaptor subunit [Streptomyces sulphureus]